MKTTATPSAAALATMTTAELKAEMKAVLERKFLELVHQGWTRQAAFADVMGAFEAAAPGLAEKL